MKRKLSLLFMPFLALGLFGAINATKDDKTVVAKAATQMIGIDNTSERKTRIEGNSAFIYFTGDPAISLDDITIRPNSFESSNPDWARHQSSFMNSTMRKDRYNMAPGVPELYVIFDGVIGFPDGADIVCSLYVEYTLDNVTYNGNLYFSGNAYTHTEGPIARFSAPTNVVINDNTTLEFTPGESADRHSVRYLKDTEGEEEVYTEDNISSPYTLKTDLEPGVYRVQVRAHMDDEVSSWVEADKKYSVASIDATKLSDPQNVHVNGDVLTFDEVPNASSYSVEYLLDGVSKATETANDTTYTLNSDLDAGEYTIRVRADGNQTEWTDSEWVEAEEKFVVESKVPVVTLSLQNVYNTNFGRFSYTIDRPGVILEKKDLYINGSLAWFEYLNDHEFNAQDIAKAFQGEEYVFEWKENNEVIARGVWTNVIEGIVKLSAPVGVVINDDPNGKKVLQFQDVPNASGYHVQYRQGGALVKEHDITNGGYLNPDNDLAIGHYDVVVKALGDGENFDDSDYTSPIALMIEKNPAIEAEAFLAKWRALFVGNSICDALDNRAESVKALINEYDALDADVKAIVDAAKLSDLGVADSFAEHIEWARTVIGENEAATNASNVLLANFNNSNSVSMVLVLVGLSLATMTAYVVIRKKKIAE